VLRAVRASVAFVAIAAMSRSLAAQDIQLRLLFDGQPLRTAAAPEFTCFDEGRRTWIGCHVRGSAETGFVLERPPAGRYTLHVQIDENTTNPARFPGDYDVFHSFAVTDTSPLVENVDVHRLMRVTEPWDNDKGLDGMLTSPWSGKPAFDTPRVSWSRKVAVTFRWDPVVRDAEYKYVVFATRASPYERGPELLRGQTRERSVTLFLPQSREGHYFQFALSANHDGHEVGELFTHDAGAQGWTLSFIVRDRSLPRWTYGLTASLVIVAAFGLARLPRPVLKWAAAGAAATVVVLAGWRGVQFLRGREDAAAAREAERSRLEEQSRRRQVFLSEWRQAVPQPAWWDNVPPSALAIHSLSDLLAIWQSGTNDEASRRRFHKLAYQAILDHPDDEHLVATAIHLMAYTADSSDRFALVKFGVDHFFSYNQRTDNCANCKIGDTSGEMVRDLAEAYISRGEPDDAIQVIERLVRERDTDISAYNLALTFEVMSRACWNKKDAAAARKAIEEGLRRFPRGWQADQLRRTLATYDKPDA